MQTFEQVQQHIESVDVASLPKTLDLDKDLAIQICPLYKAVRPVLMFLTTFPFFPASWKAIITTFTGVLDQLCP